jgi:hypothetical protein
MKFHGFSREELLIGSKGGFIQEDFESKEDFDTIIKKLIKLNLIDNH